MLWPAISHQQCMPMGIIQKGFFKIEIGSDSLTICILNHNSSSISHHLFQKEVHEIRSRKKHILRKMKKYTDGVPRSRRTSTPAYRVSVRLDIVLSPIRSSCRSFVKLSSIRQKNKAMKRRPEWEVKVQSLHRAALSLGPARTAGRP